MLVLQGNVILTDAKYEILTLLRSHRDDAKGVAIMARHPYPLQTVRLRKPVSEELLREALATADPKATARSEPSYPKPKNWTLNPKMRSVGYCACKFFGFLCKNGYQGTYQG